ncbi:MAG TPA: transposase [Accumulibacter sp.]|uniref:Transposase n=2 Tax=Candidatus Accumulibacter TaxID=327159 RepID=A0A7D5SCY8_9PROT|nr:MAG: transposase [Candidatus Accumulibacter cognatus]TMQ74558.1 hypothetical protein ACCUM_4335 [Candidatus Accumulibacter phosphatis]HNM76680.1 transposase [Accumulibacter sp.]
MSALPEKYWRRRRTTNLQEWLNEEMHRRERVIRIFPKLVDTGPVSASGKAMR